MKRKKRKSLTEEFRRNPWKFATIVLATVCFALIVGLPSQIKARNDEDRRLCDIIQATPAWVDSYGAILGYGVLRANNTADLYNTLKEERVKLVYNSDCVACEKQIEIFGDYWEDYQKAGLTLNCKEVTNGKD